MPTVKLNHFTCPGAGNDTPQEGFEVMESEAPFFQPGDFLLDLSGLEDCEVEVIEEEDLDFDPRDFSSHPW